MNVLLSVIKISGLLAKPQQYDLPKTRVDSCLIIHIFCQLKIYLWKFYLNEGFSSAWDKIISIFYPVIYLLDSIPILSWVYSIIYDFILPVDNLLNMVTCDASHLKYIDLDSLLNFMSQLFQGNSSMSKFKCVKLLPLPNAKPEFFLVLYFHITKSTKKVRVDTAKQIKVQAICKELSMNGKS